MEEKEPLLTSDHPRGGNKLLSRQTSSDQSISSDEEIDALLTDSPRNDFTGTLVFAIASCILGSSFMVGYNTGVLNAPAEVMKSFYNCTYYLRHGSSQTMDVCLSQLNSSSSNQTSESEPGTYMTQSQMTFLWGMTVAAFAFGGTFGGVSAGYFTNKFGRRGALLRNNVLHLIAAAILVASRYVKSYEMLIAGRFLVGVSAGVCTGAAPLYLSEIAPTSLRGFAGTFNQLAITSGVLAAEVLGLKFLLGTSDYWHILLGLTCAAIVWQVLTLSWCPETPRYLMINQNNEEEAEKALVWLRGRMDVSEELEDMKSEMENTKGTQKFSVLDLLRNKALLTPLIISVVLQMSQQFSGINAVIYYSTDIFKKAGLSSSTAQYATIATGGVNVAMTFVSALIMDKAGRRTLHLTGLGGMFIFSLILVLSYVFQEKVSWLRYVCVGTVLCYIISFATGPGAIPWFIVAELFSQGPRTAAVSVATLVNWLCNFTVGIVVPELQDFLGKFFFLPFTVMLLLFWIFTFIKVPETKGKTIEEITAIFDDSISKRAVAINKDTDQKYKRLNDSASES
ncbi:hypothetical protein FSP39_016190 [Pinctada imbricata]|uniref:Major facilitator superfamily (MFS) profile domain-containing protein n=1 Tax=Pinctada imbricata TaxID=66713 RepID=A0AA89C878_PINIB|nr:hypothetical protein FSP39_016190 [Pinctada imbricata]